MKKLSKILSVVLSTMLVLSALPVSAGAMVIPADGEISTHVQYAGFDNTAATALNSDYATSINSSGTWEHAAGKFGKTANNNAIYLKSGYLYLRYGFTYAADNTDSVRFEYEVATDADGGHYLEIPLITLKNNSQSSNRLWEIKANASGTKKVYIAGVESDLVWTDSTWHDVDIIVAQGANPNLTVVIDGKPVPCAATFDGVKTTATRIALSGGSSFDILNDNNIRITPTGTGMYFDNWKVTPWDNEKGNTTYASGSEYEYTLREYAGNELKSTLEPTHTVTEKNDDGDHGTYLEISPKTAETAANKAIQYQGVTREDVIYRHSVDYKIDTTPTYDLINFEYYSSRYLFRLLSSTPTSTIKGAPVRTYDGTWHTVSLDYDSTNGNTNYSVYYDEMPLTGAPVKATADVENLELRFGAKNESYGIDNYIVKMVKTKPLIKDVTYTTSDAPATDDYSVNTNVDTITLKLTSTIAGANADTVNVYDNEGTALDTSVVLGDDKQTVTITMNEELESTSNYKIVLESDLSCENSTGWSQTLGDAVSYDFKTARKPLDWVKVQLVDAQRVNSGTAEEPVYTWPEATNYNGWIADNSKVGATITMNNTTGSDVTFAVIVAVYDANNCISSIHYDNVTFENGGESSETVIAGPVSNMAGTTVRAFVWNNMNAMQPITQSFNLYHWNGSSNDCTEVYTK